MHVPVYLHTNVCMCLRLIGENALMDG